MRRLELLKFTKNLSAKIAEGEPLVRAIKASSECEGEWPLIGEGLTKILFEGGTLTDALGACPNTFDRAYINLVKCAEIAGTLYNVFPVICDYIQSDMRASLDLYLIKLSIMLDAGCPLLQSLKTAQEDLSIKDDCDIILETVKEGEYISTGMENSCLFSDKELDRIRIAEQSNDMKNIATCLRSMVSVVTTC